MALILSMWSLKLSSAKRAQGGSGKTFLLFQTACDAALANRERKVLVVDFSVYSETSALLMGGLSRSHDGRLGATIGMQNTVDHIAENKRADCLVRDLYAYSQPAAAQERTGLFGFGAVRSALFGDKKRAAPRLDEYAVQPHHVNPRVPDNLYLIGGAGKLSWPAAASPVWASSGEEWNACAAALRKGLDNLDGEWHVFVDTDHLAASHLTKLALGAVDDVVIPLNLDEGDFQRLFEDATCNALFTDVMMPMAAQGCLRAKVRSIVFSKVLSNRNCACEREGMELPFTPAKNDVEMMQNLAASARLAVLQDPELEKTFADDIASSKTTDEEFCRRFCTACKTFPAVACSLTKLNGAPLCTLDHTDATLEGCTADTRPKADTLEALRDEVSFIRSKILGCRAQE
jgi:cellulose biosynthesis protein BcsQ